MNFAQTFLVLIGIVQVCSKKTKCPSEQDLKDFLSNTATISQSGIKFNECSVSKLQGCDVHIQSVDITCNSRILSMTCTCNELTLCEDQNFDPPVQCRKVTTTVNTDCSLKTVNTTTFTLFEDFHLPTAINKTIKIEPKENGYNIQLLGVACVGEMTKYTVEAQSSDEVVATKSDHQCCVKSSQLKPLSIAIDGLKPATNYNLTIFAYAECYGKNQSNVIHLWENIPPTKSKIPTIRAQKMNITSTSASVTWIINPDDCVCDPVNFSLSATYSNESTKIFPQSLILRKADCKDAHAAVVTLIDLLPYRNITVTAQTCMQNDRCGGNTSLTDRTLPAEANPIDQTQLLLGITSSSISVSWYYHKDNCTGPTTFTLSTICLYEFLCTLSSNSASFENCENSAFVYLVVDGLFNDVYYNLKVIAEVDGVAETTTVVKVTQKTTTAGPNLPSFRLLKVTSRYAVLSWDFNIKSDCFAQAILYSGSVTQVDSGEISPISHLNITDCFIFPSYEASFNLTELHPYRSYHNLTLSSCDSRDCYLEYDYHNITFSTDAAGAEKLAISQTKLFLSHNAIMATIEFSYSDCFGPTKFELSLSLLTSFDSIELDYTFPSVNKTVSNLNYPQCPDSNEEITVELLHWRPYRFYHLTVTPSTNVSSAEPTVITVGTESAAARNIVSADVQISAISFREMQISWEFSNEDCYGPTFFNLTYVSAHGEIEFQLYNSSNFPNCPLYNATLKEIVRITNLTSGTKYQFFLTPYTDKGTEANPMVLGAETLAEPVEETGKTSIINWYTIVLPIIGGLIIIGATILIAIKGRQKFRSIIPRTTPYLSKSVPIITNNSGIVMIVAVSRPVKVRDFERNFKGLCANSHEKLKFEYEVKLTGATTFTSTILFISFSLLNSISPKCPETPVAMLEENAYKNRFTDIIPFDNNRVRLARDYVNFNQPQSSQTCETEDYINASFIEGFNKQAEYIAAMGPIGTNEHFANPNSNSPVNTVPDFLQMIIEQNVKLVVMMTLPRELKSGRIQIKSAQYWPTIIGESIDFDNSRVTLVSEEFTSPIYDVRLLRLTKGDTTVLFHHFLYKNMLDYGITRSDKMLDFVRNVRSFSIYEENPRQLILVHCSAGAGRTGTFIAVNQLLQKLDENTEFLDVFNTVLNLRKQRVRLVQNEDQYRLIYQVVGLAIQRKFFPDGGSDHEYETITYLDPETPTYENFS